MLAVSAVVALAIMSAYASAADAVASATGVSTTTTTTQPTTTTIKAVATNQRASSGCVDSDGGKVFNVKGVANGANGRFNDKCLNPNDLKEYYCEGSVVKPVTVRCDKGCSAGACRSATGTEIGGTSSGSTTATTATTVTTTLAVVTTTATASTVSSKCTDSDGGLNYYLKGTTKGVNGEYLDSCSTKGRVKEWYCFEDMAMNLLYRCPEGCLAGACKGTSPGVFNVTVTSTSTTVTTTSTTLKATTTTIAKQITTASCTDSDGGKNYGVKGITVGSNGRFEDKCRSPATLEEYYCDSGKAVMELKKCEKGCTLGYCRESAGTQTTVSTIATTTTLLR